MKLTPKESAQLIQHKRIEARIAAAVAAEREACAKIAEDRIVNDAYPYGRRMDCDEIAAKIRERGQA